MASRMNSKESLYKKKTLGMANREIRAKLKAQQSKTKRDDLLASKRRIPLSIIQEEKSSPKPKKPTTRKHESELRLQKLKEWKKARDEAKKKSQQAKQPFVPTATKPKAHNIFNLKPWVSNATTTTTNGKSKPIQKSEKPVTKPVPKPAAVKTSRPGFKLTRPAVSVATTKSTAPKTIKPTTKPPTITSKLPKKLPVKPKEDTSKAVKLRPQTRSMTKSVVSKVKAESKKSCSTKIRTNSGSKLNKSPPTKSSKRTVTTRSVSKVTTKDTAEMMDITIEVSNIAPEDKSLSSQITPPKTRRYDPVHPSPLLRSHSASVKRRETQLFSGPPPVTDPVWIPGHANNLKSFVQPDFDDAFGSFSPFKFGGSDNNFQFTFRKQLSQTVTDSMEDDSIQTPVTPDARIVRRSLGSGRKSSSKRNVSMDEGAMIVEVVNEGAGGEEMETGSSALEDNSPEVTEPQIDIVYFRKLHSDVVASLSSLCEVWEGKTAALEDNQPDPNMEEVLGQVRTTVCQGRLLMRKKLAQYLGLVGIAETQSGERETTSQDLQGFWDMVYFQVEDVYKKFHDLEDLENSGWTVKAPTPKKRKATKKRVAKKSAAAASSTEESERLQAAREKREAQRNKLKEMRMAAKRARGEVTIVQEEEENVFTTPKKSKICTVELSSSKSGSAFKNGRRRSLRVRNRSIYSPCATEEIPCDAPYSDIPIAPLISFD